MIDNDICEVVSRVTRPTFTVTQKPLTRCLVNLGTLMSAVCC